MMRIVRTYLENFIIGLSCYVQVLNKKYLSFTTRNQSSAHVANWSSVRTSKLLTLLSKASLVLMFILMFLCGWFMCVRGGYIGGNGVPRRNRSMSSFFIPGNKLFLHYSQFNWP